MSKPTNEQYIDGARALFQKPDVIEIDDDAPVRVVEDNGGAWVQAWVYCSDEEAKKDE